MKNIYFPDNYIVFDLETTGLRPDSCEIIEIGAVKIINQQVADTFSMLVKPNEEINSFISGLTGITNEMVKDAPSINEAMTDFLTFIEDYILIGHNVNFDLSFLRLNMQNQLGIVLENKSIDNLRYARKLLPQLSHHKLGDLVNYFNLYQESAHRAFDDAQATYEVFEKLRKIFDEIKPETSEDNLTESILKLENQLLKKAIRSDAAALSQYLTSDYTEICTNGFIYHYTFNDTFPATESESWQIQDFKIKELSKSLVHATYILIHRDYQTICSSLWKKEKKNWRLSFHQSTLKSV